MKKLKKFLKRSWHIILISAGVLLPVLAAFSDAADELGVLGKIGIIGVSVIGVATTVSHAWKPPKSSVYRRVFAVLGTVANIASPTLAFIYTNLPSTTKGYLYVGAASALMGSWKSAFGPATDTQPTPDETPPGGGEKPSGTNQ